MIEGDVYRNFTASSMALYLQKLQICMVRASRSRKRLFDAPAESTCNSLKHSFRGGGVEQGVG